MTPTLTPRHLPLPKRQQAVLDFIRSYRAREGISPSFQEICDELGIRSKNGVKCHIVALERKGVLRGGAFLPRSLVPVDDPARTEALAYLSALPTERLVAIYRYERDSDGMAK